MPETKTAATAAQEHEPVKKTSRFMGVIKYLLHDKKSAVGLIIVTIFVIVAITGQWIAPFNPNSMSADILHKPFTPGHIFGTDNLGRDVFSRVVIGTRYSIVLGVGATLMSVFVAMILGSCAGFIGGFFDEALMRILDVIQSVPGTLLNMALAAAFGSGFVNLMLAMGIGGISSLTRLQRSCVLSVRKMEYVDAASATNVPFLRKVVKHVIPNGFAPTLVSATMHVSGTIMAAAGLSFLGCGLSVTTPEWGAMLSASRDYLKNAPYLCIIPGSILVIFVLGVNLLGDGLRDALDPKLKK